MHVLLPGAELTGVAADVATAQGCAALFGQAPDADILVNNAGTAILNNFFDQDDSEWLELFQLNVMSGVRAARHYVPKMMERGWGRVVFVSSESGLNIPKEMIDYGVTKTERSEEHTSELQSLMRISYAVFCLKKKKHETTI